MKRLTFTPAAQADIDNTWNYSFREWGLERAERYIKEIGDTFWLLASGQKRGRVVDVRQGYLKYLIGQHMIYFIARNDVLEVVRILHGKQDVKRHL